VEIPGVSNLQFLREALNSQRKGRGEEPLSGGEFLKLAREKAALLKMDMEMLKRPVNVGFSGGEKKRAEMVQMGILDPSWRSSMKPIRAWTSTRCASAARASTPSCASPTRPCC
jgi:Fe-S cluster assembly ATPase SufC